MIKTTPRQVAAGFAAINALISSKLPAKAAYSVAKLAKAMESETNDFNAARYKIFEDAGCKVVEDQWTHADADVMAAVMKSVEELLDAETEISALPLDLEQFGTAEVPGGAFLGLYWSMKE